MEHLNILIKPASSLCNMNCEYCFYYDLVKHREISSYGMMTEETLKKIVQRVYEHRHLSATFMFQGGEPLLIGLPFYKTLISCVKQYNINKIPTHYAVQTNGTLLTEEFASFFKENNFLVGISIDGHKMHHDKYRLMVDETNSFDKVMVGLEFLRKYKVDFNILIVVTSDTVKHTEQIYKYLSSLGTMYLQFIPYIDSFGNTNPKFHLDDELYSEFLVRLFDVWQKDFYNGKRVSIRYFDDLIKIIYGYYPSTCMMMGSCTMQNVIEADGSVYPCDFYVLDEYKIGNVYNNSFDELKNHSITKNFVMNSRYYPKDCQECKFFQLCKGGCRRYKEPLDAEKIGKTRFCESYKMFFNKRFDQLLSIAHTIAHEQKR